MPYCINCGSLLNKEDLFCTECGKQADELNENQWHNTARHKKGSKQYLALNQRRKIFFAVAGVIVVAGIVLVIIFSLTSKSTIIGQWKSGETVIVFLKNGDFLANNGELMKYEILSNSLIKVYDSYESTILNYSLDKDTLIIDSTVFIRTSQTTLDASSSDSEDPIMDGTNQNESALSFDEAENQEGVFIKREDNFYALQRGRYGEFSHSSLSNACLTDSRTEYIPTIFAGDQLVIYSGSTYQSIEAFEVFDQGYTIPVPVGLYESHYYPFRFYATMYLSDPNFPEFSWGPLDIDEVNGNSGKNFDRVVTLVGAYNSKNLLIDAEQNESFTFGYYSGTSFQEFSTTAFAKYYVYDHKSPIILNVNKTKQGYFVIDYEGQLKKGLYVIHYGFNWYEKLLFYVN